MIIKCTEKEKKYLLANCSLGRIVENSACHTTDCVDSCEECFEKHNVKFEIVEDKENE